MFDPSYAIGFTDPRSQETVYISTAILFNPQTKESKDIFTYNDFGRGFPSKTKAKKFLREFRMNFCEDNYQHMRNAYYEYKGLPLSSYEIKVQSRVFDQNAELCRNTSEFYNDAEKSITQELKCQ